MEQCYHSSDGGLIQFTEVQTVEMVQTLFKDSDLYSPMFRVTVMMLSDMVESVTLLKDTD